MIHFPDFIKEGHVMDVIPFVALIMHLSILSPIGAEVGISDGEGFGHFLLKKKIPCPQDKQLVKIPIQGTSEGLQMLKFLPQ